MNTPGLPGRRAFNRPALGMSTLPDSKDGRPRENVRPAREYGG